MSQATEWNRETLLQLAKEMHVKVDTLLVEDKTNDPFYLLVAEASAKAKWFTSIYNMVMTQHPNIKPHLRRLHYAYCSLAQPTKYNGEPYLNDDKSWSSLVGASKEARYNKLVDYEDFTDRRNPEAQINADFTTPHVEVEAPSGISLTSQRIDQLHELDMRIGYPTCDTAQELAEQLADAWSKHLAEQFKYNVQKLQPYLLEVWIEKSTMNEELEPICRRFNANFQYGLGQQSITKVAGLIHRVLEADHPTRIAYISDFDSQGNTMPEAVARKLQFDNITSYNNKLDIKLHHLALTAEQVEHYQLPKSPTRSPQANIGTEGKLGADELQAYHTTLSKYGDTLRKRQPYSVELDALATFHVGELERLLTEFLSKFYDPTLGRKIEEAIGEYKQEVYDSVYEGVLVNESKITAAIEKVDAHYTYINEMLAVLHERAKKIKEAVQTSGVYDEIIRLQNEHVDLSELQIDLPEPEVDDESFTGEWLYDSNLKYIEQTRRLRAHRLFKDIENDPKKPEPGGTKRRTQSHGNATFSESTDLRCKGEMLRLFRQGKCTVKQLAAEYQITEEQMTRLLAEVLGKKE